MNIPVFLSSDNNYAPYLATTMASICANTKSFVEFYVLDGGISKENQEKIKSLNFINFSVEFLEINPEKEFSNIKYINEGEYITLSTYNRFLIPKLKPNLEKIIYLDCDIVALGDIKELYEVDLNGYALGAAWDESYKDKGADEKKLLDLSDDFKCLNAGVLLLDIQKWIKDDIVSKLFEIEKKYRGKIFHADNSLLNKYFDGKYKVFDIKFNYLDGDCIAKTRDKYTIRHFASVHKPWFYNPDILGDLYPNLEDFWLNAKMTPFYDEMKSKIKSEDEHKKLKLELRVKSLVSKKHNANHCSYSNI